MATVRQFGHFPWCPWSDQQAFLDWLGYDDYPEGTFDLTSMNSLMFPNLAAAMAAYWRVRKWRVTGQTWYGLGAGMVELINLDATIDRSIESEKELFCLINKNSPPQLSTLEYSVFENTLQFSFQFPQAPADIPPAIGALSWFSSVFVGGPEEGGWPAISTVDIEDSSQFDVGLNFLQYQNGEIVIRTRLANVPTPEEISSNPEWNGVRLSLRADEYWPYDPEDGGGPIYDIATGNQLRAFP